MSKYWVFSGQYFPVFELHRRKYEPEKTPYWNGFHAVYLIRYRTHQKEKLESFFPLYYTCWTNCISDTLGSCPISVKQLLKSNEKVIPCVCLPFLLSPSQRLTLVRSCPTEWTDSHQLKQILSTSWTSLPPTFSIDRRQKSYISLSSNFFAMIWNDILSL